MIIKSGMHPAHRRYYAIQQGKNDAVLDALTGVDLHENPYNSETHPIEHASWEAGWWQGQRGLQKLRERIKR